MVDFSEASYEDLLQAKAQVEQELINRKKYIMGDTCRQIRVLVTRSGLDFGEVLDALVKANAPKPEKVVRYRHPENPSLTWTGRGKKPNWIHFALESGNYSLEDLAVDG